MMNDEQEPKGNPLLRNMAIWSGIIVALLLIASIFSGTTETAKGISYSTFREKISSGDVKSVSIAPERITGKFQNDEAFATIPVPGDNGLYPLLDEKNVDVQGKAEEQPSLLLILIYQALPFLLILGIAFFVLRQMQKGGGASGAMGFGKSKAKMLTEKHGKVTFEDVAGIDEAREELQEIVEFLKDPHKFSRLGGKIPTGALLVGPPGTGKTLLARAIAGEAGVPFFSISGSDFVEMFVGVGASRVRDMFEQAKKNAPCIIFIDEIDAVGRSRGSGLGNQNDEREQTLNQLLVEMDGFEANEGIIIVAATNRADVLDKALLRPGRFDRQVVVPLPDIDGRTKILQIHSRNKPLAPDVDLQTIARGTPGFSGADLANLLNEGALLAARKGKRMIAMLEIEEAKDKVYMGAERKSAVMTEEDKKATAYHEVGHALVSLYIEGNDPLHKVTIIPRGSALGVTWNLPERDTYTRTQTQLKGKLALCFGGRIAEQIIYGNDALNTGAHNDIEQATQIARQMVTEFGMSEKVGWLQFRQDYNSPLSEQTSQLIDAEIRRLVQEAEARARKVLTDHIDDLHVVTAALIEFETLSGDEVKKLIETGKIDRNDGASTKPSNIPQVGTAIPKAGRRKPAAVVGAAPQGA
jgi:cell division protease FtsH